MLETEASPRLLRVTWVFLFVFVFVFFFLKDFIYSRETQRERQRRRQREKQAPCRKPDVGLNPGTPGSHPGLKAALNG